MMRLRQHESIYLAIRDRNPDAAQQAMFAHIAFVGKQFEPGISLIEQPAGVDVQP